MIGQTTEKEIKNEEKNKVDDTKMIEGTSEASQKPSSTSEDISQTVIDEKTKHDLLESSEYYKDSRYKTDVWMNKRNRKHK